MKKEYEKPTMEVILLTDVIVASGTGDYGKITSIDDEEDWLAI